MRVFNVQVVLAGLIASLWSSAVLSTDIPAPIGLDIRPVASSSEAANPSVAIDAAELSALRDAVSQAEAKQATLGPYDPTLANVWLSLANRALALGDEAQAGALFQRSIHNLRLNEGLTSPTQIDVLDNWIESLRRSGDNTALGNILTYRYRLVGFGAEIWTRERVAYAVDFLDHKLFELTQGNWLNREREILWLLEHVSSATDEACFQPTSSIEWCRPLAKRHLAALYFVEHRVTPFVEDQRELYFPPPRNLRDPSETYRLEYEESRAIREGSRLLKRLEELAESDDVEIALLHADWQWIHGRNIDAMRRYQSIWVQEPKALREPVPLPWGLGATMSTVMESGERPSALLSYTVSVFGKPRNIVELDAEDSSGQRIRKALRKLKFRPAFVDGERIESEQTQRFELLDP